MGEDPQVAAGEPAGEPLQAPVELVGRGVPVVEPVWSGRGVMMAARRLRLEGQGVGPAELSPEYAREPEAVTLWRQRHGG